MKKRSVVWDEKARASLKEVYYYIREDSLLQAEKVKSDIVEATKRLSNNPEFHPPDKYRKDKDTRFRAFEKHSYRISYFITDSAIRILRVRHVKRKPKRY